MSSHNIRSLLRAELSTRKISHPHASYSNNKSSLLSCTVCHLIIKSETLWEGHLRSANHRRNAQKLREGEEGQQRDNGDGEPGMNVGRKRKADDVELDERGHGAYEDGPMNGARKRKAEADLGQDDGGEGRKKTKGQPPPPSPPPTTQSPSPPPPPSSSRPMNGFIPASVADNQPAPAAKTTPEPYEQPSGPREASSTTNEPHTTSPSDPAVEWDTSPTRPSSRAASGSGSGSTPAPAPALEPAEELAINEAEWAAFEREVLPLTVPDQKPTPQRPTDPSRAPTNVTITAAPLSASDLAAQKTATEADDRRAHFRSKEEEAEAEREEEARRLQDEFDVQGEMEDRVRRLRERRDAIRLAKVKVGGGGGGVASGGEVGEQAADIIQTRLRQESREEDGDGDGDGGGDDVGGHGNAVSREKSSHGNEEQEESEDDPEEFDAWAWALR